MRGRVLNVLYDERLGGPQYRVIQVAKGLSGLGWETVVVVPRGGEALTHHLTSHRVRYEELSLVRPRDTVNPIVHSRYLASFGTNVRRLRSIIRRHSIQLVHTNGLMHLQAAIAAKMEGVRLVWHVNDFVTPGFVRPVLLAMIRRWADRIVVASQAVADYYFADSPEVYGRLRVLHAPVDTEVFKPGGADEKAVFKEFGVAEGGILIGTVGHLTPIKGTRTLIEAVPAIVRRFPKLKVLVIGEKLENRMAYCSGLIRLTEDLGISDTVIFTGRRTDVPRLLKAMTVYVHPSYTEACPMAVLEASASGLPVVATDVGGTRELVAAGVSGLLISPSDPEDLSEAVLRLLESPATLRQMGERGAQLAHEKFSLERCVQRHRSLYEELIPR